MRRTATLVSLLLVSAACSGTDSGIATTTTTTTTVAPPTTSSSATTAAPAAPMIEWGDCPFTSPTRVVDCGTLAVPANRRDPASGTIRIQAAVFRSESPTPLPDPVVYLSGGPGWPAIMSLLIGFDVVFGDFHQDRDVVLFDQRGTGLSEPDTACPEVNEAHTEALEHGVADPLGIEAIAESYAACRDRLRAAGVDLTGFDTATSAADVEDLRRALGYEQWNLYGISYGTHLALEVLRDHPDGVRAAILDSVQPPQVDPLGTQLENLGNALDEVFAACEADVECAGRYGDVEARFWALHDALESSPVEIITRFQGFPYDLTVDGTMFIVMAFYAMYRPDLVAIMPSMIDRMAEGDAVALTPFGAHLLAFTADASVGLGMNQSVTCRDEAPFADISAPDDPLLAKVHEASAGLGPDVEESCDMWGAGASPPVANEPVSTEVPVLALGGQHDPVTPPAWASIAVERLDAGYVFEFPGLGHTVSLSPCPRSIVLDFLDDPKTPPDPSCVADMPPTAFLIRP